MTTSLVCGNYWGIRANKNKKALNAYRGFEYSSGKTQQNMEQSLTSEVRIIPQWCSSAGWT
jgi:hypothetical protein